MPSESTSASVSASPNARRVIPLFRETLLGASHQAVDIGDTKRLVIAALANNRGWYSAGGVLDADRIEVLEMALDRMSTGDRDRPLVLATLCSELAIGTPLERRRALADEALDARHGFR